MILEIFGVKIKTRVESVYFHYTNCKIESGKIRVIHDPIMLCGRRRKKKKNNHCFKTTRIRLVFQKSVALHNKYPPWWWSPSVVMVAVSGVYCGFTGVVFDNRS
jgi:hypothetical protein